MNYLTGKRVYLAGALHKVDDCGVVWRDYITPNLNALGIIVDDPCKATINGLGEVGADKDYFKKLIKERKYDKVKKEFYQIIRKDLRMVDKADFLIVYHDPSIPTIGTIHEIVNAVNEKKPVLIVCDINIESINPWILTLIKPQWLFTSFKEMFNYLDVINQGKIDTSHWW